MIILFFISFILYSFAFYFYSTRLYDASVKLKYGIVTVINAFFYVTYVFYTSFTYEYLALFLLFVLYFTELKLIFKQNNMVLLFRSLTLALHVLAMRMIIIGFFSLYYDIPIVEIVAIREYRINITTILFLVTFPYVLLVKYLFSKTKYIEVIKAGQNIHFTVSFLMIIFLYSLHSVYVIYALDFYDPRMNILVIKIGVCALLGFFLCLVFDSTFSTLNTHKVKFTLLSQAIRKGRKDIRKLAEEATIDNFTQLKVREVAYSRMNQFLEDDEPFYVLYVDMNGLKHVNDTYGHHEGDFYIITVTEALKDVFYDETIARLGGDEFLVVGKNFDESKTIEKVITLRSRISLIAEEYEKDYETSISYGLVVVDRHYEFENIDAIIKLADERMYANKKSMKKQRDVVVPYKHIQENTNKV